MDFVLLGIAGLAAGVLGAKCAAVVRFACYGVRSPASEVWKAGGGFGIGVAALAGLFIVGWLKPEAHMAAAIVGAACVSFVFGFCAFFLKRWLRGAIVPETPASARQTADTPAQHATGAGASARRSSDLPAVFVSHSTADRTTALSICESLEKQGLSCWVASRDVGPGENFQEAIVRAIRAVKVMVLVFSSSANTSEEIKKELVLASQNKVLIIPVRVEDVVPNEAFAYEFATRQWIDLFADWERETQRLGKWVSAVLRPGQPQETVA